MTATTLRSLRFPPPSPSSSPRPARRSSPASGGSTTVDTSIADPVTVSGGFNPTGNVTFDLFNRRLPLHRDPAVHLHQSVDATTACATSGSFPTIVAGTDDWMATYNGDTNNEIVTSACGDESVIIGQATTSVATQVNMAGTTTAITSPIPLGSSVYDTATITHAHDITPTGTVTYTFYGNGDCTGSGTGAGTVTLTASGTVPNSDTQGPLTAGSYSFQAAYSGDADFIGSTSPCEPFTIGMAAPPPRPR